MNIKKVVLEFQHQLGTVRIAACSLTFPPKEKKLRIWDRMIWHFVFVNPVSKADVGSSISIHTALIEANDQDECIIVIKRLFRQNKFEWAPLLHYAITLELQKEKKTSLMRSVLRSDHIQGYRNVENVTKSEQIIKGFFFLLATFRKQSVAHVYITTSAPHILRAEHLFSLPSSWGPHIPSSLPKAKHWWFGLKLSAVHFWTSFSQATCSVKDIPTITSFPLKCLWANRKANIQISEVPILRWNMGNSGPVWSLFKLLFQFLLEESW